MPRPSHPKWILVEVRGLPLHHLYCHDPKRPDVDLWTILFPCDDLWGHPVRCSDHRGALVLLGSDLSTEAKVGCVGEKEREEERGEREEDERGNGEDDERERRMAVMKKGGKQGQRRGRKGVGNGSDKEERKEEERGKEGRRRERRMRGGGGWVG